MASTPKTKTEFWESKFIANVERDHRKVRKLQALGWCVGIIWECEARDPQMIVDRLHEIFGHRRRVSLTDDLRFP